MESQEKIKPKLYLLGVSLGNPKDITPHVVELLGEANLILGEEQRTTSTLLKKLGIAKPFELLNEHSSKEDIEALAIRLTSIPLTCLMSDAGMPTIEDPGLSLVNEARNLGVEVHCAPGPTALVTALALSGFPSSPFTFCGFLPREKHERKKSLLSFLKLKHTLIFYETPYRYKEVLKDIAELSPSSSVYLGLDLTNPREIQKWGSAKELSKEVESLPKAPPVLVVFPKNIK